MKTYTNETEYKKYEYLNTHTTYGKSNHGRSYEKLIRSFDAKESLLDVGTGNGNFCKQMSPFYKKIYGVEWAIEQPEENNSSNIEYIKCAAQNIPLSDNSVDITTSWDFLEHVIPQDVNKVMEQMVRVTKKYIFSTVATNPSGAHRKKLEKIFGDGELHPTQQPKNWWHDMFEQYGITYKLNNCFIIILND
jgi:ubiquinone/menaquinone biosynthesis C-methylase UbiE